jgi:hypothetical protein
MLFRHLCIETFYSSMPLLSIWESFSKTFKGSRGDDNLVSDWFDPTHKPMTGKTELTMKISPDINDSGKGC